MSIPNTAGRHIGFALDVCPFVRQSIANTWSLCNTSTPEGILLGVLMLLQTTA